MAKFFPPFPNVGSGLIKLISLDQIFTDWFIRQWQIHLALKRDEKISRELRTNWSFFPADLLRFGWHLRYLCWLQYLQRKENFSLKPYFRQIAVSITSTRIRDTDIRIQSALKLVSLDRERVRSCRRTPNY